MLDVKKLFARMLGALVTKGTTLTSVSGTTLATNAVFRCGNVIRIVTEARGSFGASYKTVAQLPTGYRPTRAIVKGFVPFGNTMGYLNITTGGEVRVWANGTLTTIYIDETFIVGGGNT